MFPPHAAHTRTQIHLGHRLVVSLDRSGLSFRTSEGALVETRSPVLVPPGTPYATLSTGPRVGLVVHPVRDGRRVLVAGDAPTVLSGPDGERVRGAAEALLSIRHGEDARAVHRDLIDALGRPLGPVLDRRVRVVLETLAFESERPTLDLLSERTGLSSERLRHLVVDALGIGLRRLLQWYRFTRALMRMSQPEPLAHIAAETGFSDQAHLARTTRELLGHPPSLRTSLEWRIHGDYHTG